MQKELWVNLPVKDLTAAKEFYKQAGFLLLDEKSSNENMGCFFVEGQDLKVRLFPEETFKGYTENEIANTSIGSEVLFSLSAGTIEEVDSLIFRIQQAGGTIYAEPEERNGMYGAGFCDLDGHRWNLIVMNK